MIKNVTALIKTILGILHIFLSAPRMICLLYPDTRCAMYNVFMDLIQQAFNLLGAMKNKIVVILLMCCTAGLCYSGYGLIKAESKYISAEVCYETLKERRDSVEVKTEKIQSEEDSLTRTMKDINILHFAAG